MSLCYYCGAPLPEGLIGRTEECRFCGRFLHVCRNCLFYDASVSHQCREDAADFVNEKESANFCEFFRPGEGKQESRIPTEDVRSRFHSLFR